jgi:hypothetical protein
VPQDRLFGTGDQAALRSKAGIGVEDVMLAAREVLA